MSAKKSNAVENPRVNIQTTLGNIRLELFLNHAPVTVENFLRYAAENFYDCTLFHRVIPNFMVQGGGFSTGMARKESYPSIINESGNGLSNKRGTIAMARTPEVDSATSEFFINLVDNTYLDHKNDTAAGFGYCVFGQVADGMDVVDKIAQVPTHAFDYFQDVPVDDVEILSVRKVEE